MGHCLKLQSFNEKYDKLCKRVFWNGAFTFLVIFSMEFVLAATLQIRHMYTENAGRILGIVFAYGILLFYFIFWVNSIRIIINHHTM